MNTRAFFLGAVLLAMIALLTHSVARGFLVDATRRKAARLEQAQKQQIAYAPDPQALQSSRNYHLLTTVGVALTALALVCMVVAWMRREPGWYLLLILLLFFDIMAAMLL